MGFELTLYQEQKTANLEKLYTAMILFSDDQLQLKKNK